MSSTLKIRALTRNLDTLGAAYLPRNKSSDYLDIVAHMTKYCNKYNLGMAYYDNWRGSGYVFFDSAKVGVK